MIRIVRRRLAGITLAASLGLMVAAPAAAQPAACPDFEGITCDGWVTDQTGLIQDDARLEAAVDRVVGAHGHQIAVVLINDSGSMSPAEFAAGIGNAWGVGSADRDDGIVVLVDIGNRRTEIAAGPGAGLTDADNAFIAGFGDSFFAAGDFDGGIAGIIGGLEATLAAGGGVPDTGSGGTPPVAVDPIVETPAPTWRGTPAGTLPALLLLGVGGVVATSAYQGRKRRRDETARRRRQSVDAELARLAPAGHEVALSDDLFVPAPASGPDVRTDRVVAAVSVHADGLASDERDVYEAAWVHGALAVVDRPAVDELATMPLELAVTDEGETLEVGVDRAARAALEPEIGDDEFAVRVQSLAGLVDALRPYRVAEARQAAAREVLSMLVETPIGPTVVTEFGAELIEAAGVLPPEGKIAEAVEMLQRVRTTAATKTSRLVDAYHRLDDTIARPAVAAALADVDDDIGESVERYEQVRRELKDKGGALTQDGLDIDAIAAFLLLNNDERNVDGFLAAYRSGRKLYEPVVAVEFALAGLQTRAEIDWVKEQADDLGIPISIAAALLRRGERHIAVYNRLVAMLDEHGIDSDTRRTIAGILAISTEPAQAERNWLEARSALASLGLEGSYADIAAAFGASDPRGPREFALAYAAQRRALAASSVDDADRYAPELAHEGTRRRQDTWTGEPIPRDLLDFDPFTLLYHHWVITRGAQMALGWQPLYRDESWSKGNTWFGGGGGFGGFGGSSGGSSWGSFGGSGGFGGFGGGSFGGGSSGGSGW